MIQVLRLHTFAILIEMHALRRYRRVNKEPVPIRDVEPYEVMIVLDARALQEAYVIIFDADKDIHFIWSHNLIFGNFIIILI